MYRALYRKYRPATFTEVVGQEHITTTLENAVKSGKTSHAYLFTGSRGTGKTSCAKILAKAVNCENPQNGNPCNECAMCKGIDNGSVLDIIEIDAASNNGVDNIRELREEANFTPVNAKFRVYIIDEVHMLSIGAFNALLKTLEEPPAHVLFILATTEVHKLPSTILSRCQRFDFKRIAPEEIAERLKLVAKEENMQLTDDGAMLISRIADGAMRDALSILDRCVSYEGVIDSNVVAESSGLAGREYVFELCDCILNKDAAKALEIINKLYNDSCDMERLLAELTNHFRNLMISKAVNNFENVVVCPDNEIEIIKRQAEGTTLGSIMSSIDTLTASAADMKQGANRRTIAELCIIKLCSPVTAGDMTAVSGRIEALENKIKNADIAPARAKEPETNKTPVEKKAEPVHTPVKAEAKSAEEKRAEAEPEKAKDENPGNESGTKAFDKWSEIVEKLTGKDPSMIPMLNGSSAYVYDGKYLLIKGSEVLKRYLNTGDYTKIIKNAVYETTGKSFVLGVYNETRKPAPQSPLEGFVSKAKNLGIDVQEE
ncbi:MAG: DNA polymerase III subunit gamma/tau [Clostridiales bacterium]|nr:DNA polymerase III subunit gamma/tau [Clostridiales bacterium]